MTAKAKSFRKSKGWGFNVNWDKRLRRAEIQKNRRAKPSTGV